MSQWQRKRAPDEVPTPVAVAVSDFCRRAQAPASAAEVREALAAVAESDDFRVRALTDGEPEHSPLGPFAVVDILFGASQAQATLRQACGYYDVVRELLEVRAAPAARLPSEPPVPALFTPPSPSSTSAPVRKAEPPPVLSIEARIAPKKRTAAEPSAEAAEVEAPPARERPAPRGRFTQVAPVPGQARELLEPSARELLDAMADRHDHRYAIREALAPQYSSQGQPLSLMDVDHALAKHGLLDKVRSRERERILAHLTEQRGAVGRVAWALRLSPQELRKLMQSTGVEREVEELRERYQREALAPRDLQKRLDLLGRHKYLEDLGIKSRFMESLRGELRNVFAQLGPEVTTWPERVEQAARLKGVSAELLRRSAEKLGLKDASPREPTRVPPTPGSSNT